MSEELREYDGILWPEKFDSHIRDQVRGIAAEVGLEVDTTDSAIEVRYLGRDTNRIVVNLLRRLAPILANADGEIRCEVETDEGADPVFEFYSVSRGKLHLQKAKLVREPGCVDISAANVDC
jgi:hypothetical protein